MNREDAVGLLWTPVAGGAAGADATRGATVEIPGVDIGTCGAAGISTGIAAAGAAIGAVTAFAGDKGGDEGAAELKAREAAREACGNYDDYKDQSPSKPMKPRGAGSPNYVENEQAEYAADLNAAQRQSFHRLNGSLTTRSTGSPMRPDAT